jgi:hypothetical protein
MQAAKAGPARPPLTSVNFTRVGIRIGYGRPAHLDSVSKTPACVPCTSAAAKLSCCCCVAKSMLASEMCVSVFEHRQGSFKQTGGAAGERAVALSLAPVLGLTGCQRPVYSILLYLLHIIDLCDTHRLCIHCICRL